jgi:hypothetical protein
MKYALAKKLLAAALVGALAPTITPLAAQEVTNAASSITPPAAQEATNALETAKPAESPEPPPYRPWTLGIGIGSDGIFGGGVSWRFSDHLGARVGLGFAEHSWNHLGIGGTHYDVDLRLAFEPLTVDIYPWQKSSFHVSLGVLFNQNQLSGTASHTKITIIDGQPFPTDEVGTVNMKIEQQLVNPYIGIAGNFFYFDHAHHWALGGEIGVAYTGGVRASLTRSGTVNSAIDDAIANAAHDLHRYGDQFQWWPVVKLGVTYSF